MALTNLEKFEMIKDPVMHRRVSVCIWEKALAVFDDAASTADEKNEAKARLKRPATEIEATIALIRIVADPSITTKPTDAQLQTATNKTYNQLPKA